jgi:hypothetical protein
LAAVTYTATRGYTIEGDIKGAWMGDDTAETLIAGSPEIKDPDITNSSPELEGLTVFGSITKSPVATGSEIVGYSGWSTSNYFEQPYNSDLDYGTGDYFFAGWFNTTTGGYIFDRNDSGGIGPRTYCFIDSSSINFRVPGATAIAAQDYTDDNWHFLVGLVSSSVSYIYIDGILADSSSGATTINNGSATLTYGIRYDHTQDIFDGIITAQRTGAYAPTESQILDWYNKEKGMFKEQGVFRINGNSYQEDLLLTGLNRRQNTVSNKSMSIGGQTEDLIDRDDTTWAVTSYPIPKDDLPDWREFLWSVRGGESFTWDAYGTVAASDDPVTAVLEDRTYTESRLGLEPYFNISFNVRET